MTDNTKVFIDSDGEFTSFAFPGGYPVFHVCKDSGILCADCANNERPPIADITYDDGTIDEQWHIIASVINYEDDSVYCDHCSKQIESAYGEG